MNIYDIDREGLKMTTVEEVLHDKSENSFNMSRSNEAYYSEAITSPFVPSTAPLRDKIIGIAEVAAVGVGSLALGYIYLLLLAKLGIGI